MQYDDLLRMRDDLISLRNEARDLINSFVPDIGNIMDWCLMCRMYEITNHLFFRLKVINNFMALENVMKNEKDKFEIQKIGQDFFVDFEDLLDRTIKNGRLWKFEDYRCVDWIKRLTSLLYEVQEFFKELGVSE